MSSPPAAPRPAERSAASATLAFARRLQRMNNQRTTVLAPSLFADPAWEILLDLYVSSAEGRRLSVSAACIGVSCSTATALRYLGLLNARGLVVRISDTHDGRRSYVELTSQGTSAMERLLLAHAA